MSSPNQWKIALFNSKHDVTEQQQFHALVEEIGELAEAYNTEASDDEVAEEIADVLFVARSLAELRDIDPSMHLNEVIVENTKKDQNTDGRKITKAGSLE